MDKALVFVWEPYFLLLLSCMTSTSEESSESNLFRWWMDDGNGWSWCIGSWSQFALLTRVDLNFHEFCKLTDITLVAWNWPLKVKEGSEKVDIKLNIQKTKIMASSPITSWQIDRETVETVTGFILLGSQITEDGDWSHEIKRCLFLGRKALTNLSSIQFSHSVVSDSLQSHGLQHARLPCPSPTPGAYSNSCPLSRWCHPTISSPFPPAFNLSQHQGLFQWVSSSHHVAKVLEFQL